MAAVTRVMGLVEKEGPVNGTGTCSTQPNNCNNHLTVSTGQVTLAAPTVESDAFCFVHRWPWRQAETTHCLPVSVQHLMDIVQIMKAEAEREEAERQLVDLKENGPPESWTDKLKKVELPWQKGKEDAIGKEEEKDAKDEENKEDAIGKEEEKDAKDEEKKEDAITKGEEKDAKDEEKGAAETKVSPMPYPIPGLCSLVYLPLPKSWVSTTFRAMSLSTTKALIFHPRGLFWMDKTSVPTSQSRPVIRTPYGIRLSICCVIVSAGTVFAGRFGGRGMEWIIASWCIFCV